MSESTPTTRITGAIDVLAAHIEQAAQAGDTDALEAAIRALNPVMRHIFMALKSSSELSQGFRIVVAVLPDQDIFRVRTWRQELEAALRERSVGPDALRQLLENLVRELPDLVAATILAWAGMIMVRPEMIEKTVRVFTREVFKDGAKRAAERYLTHLREQRELKRKEKDDE